MTVEQFPTPTKKDIPKLYTACAIIAEFDGHKDVAITLFRSDRTEQAIDPAVGIEGHAELDKESRLYAEHALLEYFTEDEIGQVVVWGADKDGIEVCVRLVSLPIPGNIMGTGAIPTGGPQKCLILDSDESGFSAFGLRGYYDLRQHETVPDKAEIETEARRHLDARHAEALEVDEGHGVIWENGKARALEPGEDVGESLLSAIFKKAQRQPPKVMHVSSHKGESNRDGAKPRVYYGTIFRSATTDDREQFGKDIAAGLDAAFSKLVTDAPPDKCYRHPDEIIEMHSMIDPDTGDYVTMVRVPYGPIEADSSKPVETADA